MITLKKLKISTAMSRETLAYTADIYFNGKRVGDALNEGRGGSTNALLYDADAATRAEIAALVKDHFDKKPAAERYPGMETLGDFVDDLVHAEADTRQAERLYRKTSRTILYELEGQLLQLVGKFAMNEALIAQFKLRNPTATVINGMPKDEAIRLLLKHVRGETA